MDNINNMKNDISMTYKINKNMKNEYGKCQSIIKSGKNEGSVCNRDRCHYHFNLGDFFKLPAEFRKVIDENREFYDKYWYLEITDMFYKCENATCKPNDKVLQSYIRIMLSLIGMTTKKEIRYVLFIIMYRLFDTPAMHEMINKDTQKYKTFHNCINNKIAETIIDVNSRPKTEFCNQFIRYIENNLQPNRKYLFRNKNVKHSFSKLKLRMIVKIYLTKLYNNTVENMYSPDGNYVPIIKERYDSCYNTLLKN